MGMYSGAPFSLADEASFVGCFVGVIIGEEVA